MGYLPRVLLYSLACFVFVAVVVTTIVMSVEYYPDGVKPHQREAYVNRLRQLHQLRELAEEVETEATPVAMVPVTQHDFGMVDPHTTLDHEFVIQNQGELPLQLNVIGTSCKCAVGNLKDGVLLPGEETSVTMTWNTGYKAEKYEQTATLQTNDPLRSNITLSVTGEVKAEFIAPDQIAFNTTDLGVPTEARFIVFSQAWEDFTVTDVKCDVPGFEWPGFEWYAEPADTNIAALADSQPRSAWEVRVFSAPLEIGDYEAEVTVTARPNDGGDAVERQIACIGKVRKPINFYHPDIHQSLGLDIGTLVAGEEHQIHLIVRTRTDVEREIEVLDVEPKQLRASLKPLSAAGNYRLTLTVPPDCPLLVFNADQKHGYVQVGDPNNKDFSNWFPLLGAVVTLDQ